jgi:hypothetical protein
LLPQKNVHSNNQMKPLPQYRHCSHRSLLSLHNSQTLHKNSDLDRNLMHSKMHLIQQVHSSNTPQLHTFQLHNPLPTSPDTWEWLHMLPALRTSVLLHRPSWYTSPPRKLVCWKDMYKWKDKHGLDSLGRTL